MKRFMWTLIRGIGCCEGRVSALLDGVVKGREGSGKWLMGRWNGESHELGLWASNTVTICRYTEPTCHPHLPTPTRPLAHSPTRPPAYSSTHLLASR